MFLSLRTHSYAATGQLYTAGAARDLQKLVFLGFTMHAFPATITQSKALDA